MGNDSSKVPEYTTSLSVFTPSEQKQISKIFREICEANPTAIMFRLASAGLAGMMQLDKEKKKQKKHQQQEQMKAIKGGFGNPHLRQYLQKYLPAKLIDKLYREMATIGGTNNVKEKVFVVALASILKGSLEQRAHVVRKLSNENGAANPDEVMELIEDLLKVYISICEPSEQIKSWKIESSDKQLHKLARCMAHELFYPNDNNHSMPRTNIPAGMMFNETDLEKWISRSPLFLHIMDLVLHACFNVSYIEGASSPWLIPKIPVAKVTNWEFTTLLDIPSLILINSHIPPEFQKKWRLLFSSQVHGENFAKFVSNIKNQGPSVLMIKDKDDHVFGVFAADSWKLNPDFYGTHRSFLFTLAPTVGVYQSTGINDHYMYLNQGQATLPNGLGVGGQLNYFGLWMERDNYGVGHSKAEPTCTTFNSPQLSGKPDFEIEVLEVWGVGPEPGEDVDADEDISILDRDPGAEALLELAGKPRASHGLRDKQNDNTPDQHDLPRDQYKTVEG